MNKTRRVWIIAAAFAVASACEKSSALVDPLLTVVQPLSVVIAPGQGELDMCGSLQLTANVKDFSSATVFPDSTKWWSSDTSAMSISTTGLLKTHQPILADTIRATVWSGSQTGTGQQIWFALDARNLIVPCPTNGSAAGCALPCPPGF